MFITSLVPCNVFTCQMLRSIHFYHQFGFWYKKINNIVANWFLAIDLYTVQLFAEQPGP